MAINVRKFLKAIGLIPNSSQNISAAGEMEYRSDLSKLSIHDGTTADSVVQEAKAATLTNKSIDADTNTITNIDNNDIKAAAGIVDTKLATISTAGKVSNSATTATDANTASAIVARDASGNFSAGTITAALSGNATTATTATNFSGSLAGDVSGTQGATVVDTVGGKTDTEIATSVTDTQAATSTNTVSTIVKRDASGNFSAGTITANLTGNVTGNADTATTATNVSGTVAIANGGTGQTSQTAAFDALAPTTTSGDMIYHNGSDNVRLPIGSSGQVLKVIGGVPTYSSFSGGINYVSANPDAEADTAGWSTYADAAGAQPVNGTGGSPTVTWTRSTSSPLRGSANFLFTKDAANRQGEGVSYDLTVDSADLGKVINISFDYSIASGTYADGDLTVYIYDVTNAQVIQPAPYQILNAGTSIHWTGSFQTATTSSSYRLILHVASTSASAYTLKFDNFNVGPVVQNIGTPVTDWTAYTPTFTGLGTVSNTSFQYRRVGDSLEVQGYVVIGTTAASLASLTLPNLSIDSAKVGNNNTTSTAGPVVGQFWSNTANQIGSLVTATGTSTSLVYFSNNISNGSELTPSNGNAALSSGQSVSLWMKIPILGWSSNTAMSADAGDSRVVAAKLTVATGTLNGSFNLVTFSNTTKDTHGAVNAGKNTFTVPVSGYYAISAELPITSASYNANDSAVVAIYVNGVSRIAGYLRQAGTCNQAFPHVSSPAEYLNAGDEVKVYSLSDGAGSFGGGSDNGYFSIARVSGPQQIAQSETVAASYRGSVSGTLTNSFNTATYATKVVDTHNAYSSGVFTAPVSGLYNAFALLPIVASTVVGNSFTIRIAQGGSSSDSVENNLVAFGTTVTYPWRVSVDGLFRMLAGDTLQVKGYSEGTSSSYDSTQNRAAFNVVRVGNY